MQSSSSSLRPCFVGIVAGFGRIGAGNFGGVGEAADRSQTPGTNPAHEQGESDVGSTADPWRAADARHRRQRVDGRALRARAYSEGLGQCRPESRPAFPERTNLHTVYHYTQRIAPAAPARRFDWHKQRGGVDFPELQATLA